MRLLKAGRYTSLAAAALIIGLGVVYYLGNPYAQPAASVPGTLIGVAHALLALSAAAAAWWARPLIVLACFVLLFVPVGFYLAMTPGIFALIGVAELGFLLSSVFIYFGRKRAVTG